MGRGGQGFGGGGGGLAIAALVLIIIVLIVFNNYVNPHLSNHPITLPTADQIVTFVTDAYGHATAEFHHVFNVSLNTPKLEAAATVNTNQTGLSGAGIRATLDLPGLQFSIDNSNTLPGPDKTIFTWDISILHFSPGPMQLAADVIISVVSCGQCSSTTFNVPVELAMTAKPQTYGRFFRFRE